MSVGLLKAQTSWHAIKTNPSRKREKQQKCSGPRKIHGRGFLGGGDFTSLLHTRQINQMGKLRKGKCLAGSFSFCILDESQNFCPRTQ